MMMFLFWLWWPTHGPWFILSACLWKCTCLRCCKINVLTWFVVLSCTSCLHAWGIDSVLSKPTEADLINRFGRYWYIGKTQIPVYLNYIFLFRFHISLARNFRKQLLHVWLVLACCQEFIQYCNKSSSSNPFQLLIKGNNPSLLSDS